jgi:subtilisin family serine protease
MASLKSLLAAAAAALLPLAVSAAGDYPSGTGRLANKGYKAAGGGGTGFGIESTGLPWDNSYRDEDATDSKIMIVNWNSSVPNSEVEALDSWIQGTAQKRSLPNRRRAADHQFVSSHTFNQSKYSVIDFDDMDDDFVLDIMDRMEVASIDRNLKVRALGSILAQTNAPNGLVRLSNQAAGGSQYIFDDSAGAGVTVYVVDTGVNAAHTEFSGRATFGANFITGSIDDDENGHGTHCAGTIAGRTFGVAKSASIVGVKVLDAEGSGSFDGIIAGLEWVYQQVTTDGSATKTVVSMSLGGGSSSAINDAVKDLTDAGIVVVVAAGNENEDASNSSPASAPSAITVGAIDSADDSKASFSNFGAAVDIFAPGVDVLSSFIGSNIATEVLSGTSMACPHVAGLSAYLMALEGISGPDKVAARLTELAQAAGASVKNNVKGTTNLIANNGFLA